MEPLLFGTIGISIMFVKLQTTTIPKSVCIVLTGERLGGALALAGRDRGLGGPAARGRGTGAGRGLGMGGQESFSGSAHSRCQVTGLGGSGCAPSTCNHLLVC